MKRIIAIAVAVGTLALIVFGLFRGNNPGSQSQMITLSNGTSFTLRGATFGTKHEAPGVERTWQSLVPDPVAGWLKINKRRQVFGTTDSPAIYLWLTDSPNGRRPYLATEFLFTVVHDDDGTETPLNARRSYISEKTNQFAVIVGPYPLRQQRLKIRVYKNPNEEAVGEFTLLNPNVSRARRIKVPSLPQTAHNGNLTATLHELREDVRLRRLGRQSPDDACTKGAFELKEDGKTATNWATLTVEAVDSTGVRITPQQSGWRSASVAAMETFDFQPGLWPSETYKIRFELSRKATGQFAANDLWNLRGITVPTNGGVTAIRTQMNLHGFTITFYGMSGQWSSPGWPKKGVQASLDFSISPELKGYRFNLLRAGDGKEIGNYDGAGWSKTNWNFVVKDTQATSTIDFTVALHRSRFVEFQAQPTKWDGKFSR